MPNKLKDIFSDKMYDLGFTMNFKDSNSRKKFIDALAVVENEGKAVEIDGVSSITTDIKDSGMVYPFQEIKDLTRLMIYPSVDQVPFQVNTKNGVKTVVFKRYQTSEGTVFETDEKDIIFIKLIFINDEHKLTFTYRPQPHLAKSIKDIVESYGTAIAFFGGLFDYNKALDNPEEYELMCEMMASIKISESFYNKVKFVENEFGMVFAPSQLEDNEKETVDVNELYVLFAEEKPLRLNATFSANESTMITTKVGVDALAIGSEIDLAFPETSVYSICGQEFTVYTANLLTNAVIVKVEENEDGSSKMFYDEKDSNPMYVSYTAYKTIDEARQEMEIIMEHKKRYINALTVIDYMKKELEEHNEVRT